MMGEAVVAHGDALVGADSEIGEGAGGAEEDEAGLAVFGEVAEGVGLIPLAGALHLLRAGNAPALEAHGGQIDTRAPGGGEDELILGDLHLRWGVGLQRPAVRGPTQWPARHRPYLTKQGKLSYKESNKKGRTAVKSYLLLQKRHRTDRPPEYQDDYRYPQEMVERFLEEFTTVGDLVFDPFAGFGTTLAAAERLDRKPLGVEYLPERVEFIRNRLTAKDAIVQGDARRLGELPLPLIDFSMTSPPWMMKEDPEDPLTAYAETGAGYSPYLSDLQNIYHELQQRLKPGARAVIHVTNLKRNGQLTLLAWDIARAVSAVLTFEGEIVICWEGDTPDPFGYEHEYCLVFRKG
jgi:DNA modification methylase